MTSLRIVALEGAHAGIELDAQLGPTQIVLDRAIVWQRQANKGPGDLAYERTEPAHMSFELLFDGTQTSTSVQPQIDTLQQLCAVDSILHRPPKVAVSWGRGAGALPKFEAVIESISVRYVQFADGGVPLRATADVKLEQAVHLTA